MRDFGTDRAVDQALATGLSGLETRVTACLGLHIPESRRRDLLRGAEALAQAAGAKDVGAFLRSLADAPLTDRQLELLAASLTVGETYFFREPKSLDAFRNRILPELVRQRAGREQRLRIWCAGCSTGEEAYTVAMILAEALPDPERWSVDILATDINRRALEKAQQGLYSEWSFRNLPAAQRERGFKQQGAKAFAIRHRFQRNISFAYLNLASDAYPSLLNNTNAMDVIFCRNVLMYFEPEWADSVVARFQHCLVDGGWLIVAPTEHALIRAPELVPVPFEGGTLFRKEGGPAPVRPAVWRGEQAPAEEAPPSPGTVSGALSGAQGQEPYEAALARYELGHYAEAEALLQALLTADASEGRGITAAKIYALMARVEANQGKLVQAAARARQAIAANKACPGFYYLLASILEEQHQLPEAVQMLRRAICLNPDFVLAHFALGHIALAEKRKKDAGRCFLNAAALLARMPKDNVLPESEGLTAGRLLEIIETLTREEVPA